MRIVIDSNVLFSALIKDSYTRRLILGYSGKFLFPSYIFNELKKHEDELFVKSHMRREEFISLLQVILNKVAIVSPDAFNTYKEEAKALVKDIDPDDVVFVAVALYAQGIIWSDDKKLKSQKRVLVLSTKEIAQYLE